MFDSANLEKVSSCQTAGVHDGAAALDSHAADTDAEQCMSRAGATASRCSRMALCTWVSSRTYGRSSACFSLPLHLEPDRRAAHALFASATTGSASTRQCSSTRCQRQHRIHHRQPLEAAAPSLLSRLPLWVWGRRRMHARCGASQDAPAWRPSTRPWRQGRGRWRTRWPPSAQRGWRRQLPPTPAGPWRR
jgi:hypothetical protein